MPATMPAKKKPDPAPKEPDRHQVPKLTFHLPPELRDAFRRHVNSLRPKPPESEVLRLALEEYLRQRGVELPAPKD